MGKKPGTKKQQKHNEVAHVADPWGNKLHYSKTLFDLKKAKMSRFKAVV